METYGESHHQPSAYRSATARGDATGKRFRLIDASRPARPNQSLVHLHISKSSISTNNSDWCLSVCCRRLCLHQCPSLLTLTLMVKIDILNVYFPSQHCIGKSIGTPLLTAKLMPVWQNYTNIFFAPNTCCHIILLFPSTIYPMCLVLMVIRTIVFADYIITILSGGTCGNDVLGCLGIPDNSLILWKILVVGVEMILGSPVLVTSGLILIKCPIFWSSLDRLLFTSRSNHLNFLNSPILQQLFAMIRMHWYKTCLLYEWVSVRFLELDHALSVLRVCWYCFAFR